MRRQGRDQGEEGGGDADHHQRARDLHQLLRQGHSIHQGTLSHASIVMKLTIKI
jgi:hypothetical protein